MNFFFSIIYRKSKLYRLCLLCSIIAIGFIIYQIILSIPLWHFPVGMVNNINNQITVQLSYPLEDKTDYSKIFSIGTPVYNLENELILVGYIASIQKNSKNTLFHIQILDDYKQSILLQKTRFRFLHTSPTLWLALKKFMASEQMVSLKIDISDLLKDCGEKGGDIASTFQDILVKQGHVNQLVLQILQDEKVKELVAQSIQKNIIETTDWDSLWNKIQESQESQNISDIVQSNINKNKIILAGLKGMLTFSPIQGAKQELMTQSKELLSTNHSYLLKQIGTLSLKTTKENEMPQKAFTTLKDIFQNKEIKEYITTKYGADAYKMICTVTENFKGNARIKSSWNDIQKNMQLILTKWLEALVLNEDKTAPNPWLLLAMKSAMAADRPMIIVYPKKSDAVSAGYQYFSNVGDVFDDFD